MLDESVPKALGFELHRHFVRTVQAMKWAGLSNGRLLAVMAENAFEVLVTCDQNIEYQQNPALPVGLIVLIAPDNCGGAINAWGLDHLLELRAAQTHVRAWIGHHDL